MMLVIDANAVVSALLKNGKSRQIIISGRFTLLAQDYLSDELYKHKGYIAEKIGISESEVELLITLLLRRIRIVPNAEYKAKMAEAVKLMKNDIKDAPYVACYLAMNCDGIWTNDSDYEDKEGIKALKTDYLIKLL